MGYPVRKTVLPSRARIAAHLLIMVFLAACYGSNPTPTDTIVPRKTAGQLGPTSTQAPSTPLPRSPTRSPLPTLKPIPPVSSSDWSRGHKSAPVTLIVYSDFQCPFCASLADSLSRLQRNHQEDLQIVYRHFPLITIHDKAALAGQAAEAAGEQGRFWEMHDRLFRNQAEWTSLEPEEFRAWLETAAVEMSMDVEAFSAVMQQDRFLPKMERSFQDAVASGIPGTPYVLLNGTPFQLAATERNLEAAIRLASLESRQFESYPPQVLEPDRQYSAVLQMDIGEVEIQLYPDSAPLAVNSFVYLSQEGWYDNTPLHTVNPGVLVEGGDPSGTGVGEPGYHFPVEIDPVLGFEEPGMLGAKIVGPGNNGGQFFINLVPLPSLSGTRTVLGQVIQGLDLLVDLKARDPFTHLLQPPEATIQHVLIETKP